MRLQTNMSVVYGSDGKLLSDADGPISVFDRLLGGGLEIPDVVVNSWLDDAKNCSPVILLISGPAGTGKTTLAMELVYRLSSQGIKDPRHPESEETYHFPSVYISSESPGRLLVESKVSELGWDRGRFLDAGIVGKQPKPANGGAVLVVGKDAPPFNKMQNPTAFFKRLEKYCEYDNLVKRLGERPGVVVLDSLNVLPPDDRGKHFLDLVYKLRGPFLMVVILDTATNDIGDPFWAFAVDAVIRLTQTEREDPRVGTYLLGEFLIGKARWQKHALGTHQLKIFGKIEPNSVHAPPNRKNYHGTGHLPPFRKDGGIQLYQSIHRHLSEGQKLVPGWEDAPVAAATISFDTSSLTSLDPEIGGGFPIGRCTAIVGDRGSLKSHLAYLWLLSATSRCSEPALLLSLRDDEGEALSRLKAIYDVEEARGLHAPSDLIDNGLLRVVHFRPGYIAPDEFMFRLWFHVNDFKPRRVVIASLEQLDTLFPLCSVEPVFIPSILDVLGASKITTVAIGVSGGNQPPTQYGLLPQSSLILSFTSDSGPAPGRIRLRVSRLPTARPSGGGGWIFLDGTNQLQFMTEPGAAPDRGAIT
jgi:RecA/RadA recombinase